MQKTLIVSEEGRFLVCFPLNVPLVHLPKVIIITIGSNLFGIELAWGKTIHFRNVKFIADHFDNLRLSPKRNGSGSVFVGMSDNGLPSLHAILEESASEDDSTSSQGEAPTFLSLGVATW
jgi:hypothetical protein